MRKYRVALYYMGVEAETQDDAIGEAIGVLLPDYSWAAPPAERVERVGDPLMAEACWLLKEWSTIYDGHHMDLAENSRIVAAAIEARFPNLP